MTRILGWDIGIKNLAYCILEIDDNKNKKCVAQQKNGQKCNKQAKWQSNELLFCGKHKKKNSTQLTNSNCNWNIVDWNLINLLDDPPVCNQLTKVGKVCGKKASFVKDNSYYCGTHNKSVAKDTKSIKKTNCKNVSIMNLNLALIKHIDEIPLLLETDIILLENQPNFNSRMKTLAGTLFGCLLTRGIVDKPETERRIKTIKYAAARSELKYCGKYPAFQYPVFVFNNKIKTKKQKQKYDYKKKKGKAFCQFLIKNNNETEYLKFYNANKKQDDLADAFLLAFQEMMN